MEEKNYQGLCIDGGGILGIGAARALMQMEKDSGKQIHEQFDFISGTSTGGIIAVLLGLGYSAEVVYQLYRDRGPELFYIPNIMWSMNPFKPKYSSKKLEKILDEFCGNKTIQDLKIPTYITTANIVDATTHVFYNKHTDPLTEVLLKTTAAPTYFPTRGNWIDGGVWANNPSLVGTLGFKKYKGCKLDQIKVLSLGTSGDYKPLKLNTKRMTLAHWIRPMLNFLFEGVENATEFFMGQLDLHTYERVDPKLKNNWKLDDVSRANDYAELWACLYETHKDKFEKFMR